MKGKRLFRLRAAVILAAAAVLVLGGCDNPLYELLSRDPSDPRDETPAADSFRKENTVYASWGEDEGADEYILLRADDVAGTLAWEEVYRGPGHEYTDTDIAQDRLYRYRLDKRRGRGYFTGSKTALAVGARLRDDGNEDNDREERAAVLEAELQANIHYYVFSDGRVLSDTDWYSIYVPARRTAQVYIKEEGLADGPGVELSFYVLNPAYAIEEAYQNTNFPVRNTAFTGRYLKIRVSPNKNKFVSGVTGGTVKSYTIALDSITNN
jgi:hypothetical protein